MDYVVTLACFSCTAWLITIECLLSPRRTFRMYVLGPGVTAAYG